MSLMENAQMTFCYYPLKIKVLEEKKLSARVSRQYMFTLFILELLT